MNAVSAFHNNNKIFNLHYKRSRRNEKQRKNYINEVAAWRATLTENKGSHWPWYRNVKTNFLNAIFNFKQLMNLKLLGEYSIWSNILRNFLARSKCIFQFWNFVSSIGLCGRKLDVMGSKKHKKHKSERREKYEGELQRLLCCTQMLSIWCASSACSIVYVTSVMCVTAESFVSICSLQDCFFPDAKDNFILNKFRKKLQPMFVLMVLK